MEFISKKRSFIDILLCRPVEQEVKFYNPLNIGIGKVIEIKYPEYDGKDFRIENVYEYTRELNGRTFIHCCYDLVSKSGGTAERVRLLANPIKGASAEDAYPYSLLLLKLDHEQQWDDSMTPVLEDACDNKQWVVDDDGKDDDGNQVREPYHDVYYRLNDLVDPYEAEVAEIEDEDGNGKFDPSEVRTRTVTYYDFARQVEDVPGVENTEFYIVEKDGSVEEEGYITMWKGDEIDPSRITVL